MPQSGILPTLRANIGQAAVMSGLQVLAEASTTLENSIAGQSSKVTIARSEAESARDEAKSARSQVLVATTDVLHQTAFKKLRDFTCCVCST